MSRRRNGLRDHTDTTTGHVCATCDVEAAPESSLHCDGCADRFTGNLRSLLPTVNPDRYADGTTPRPVDRCVFPRPYATDPGLWETLLSVIVGERGIDYAALAASGLPGKGAAASKSTKITDPDDPMRGSTAIETGLTLNETALAAAHDLERLLTVAASAAGSRRHRLPSTAPVGWTPAGPAGRPRRREDLTPDLAAWLLYRADAILAHPAFTDLPGLLDEAVERVLHVIDTRPRERLPYGPCSVCDGGVLSAAPGRRWAWCDGCGAGTSTAEVRDQAIPGFLDRHMPIVDVVRVVRGYGIDTRPEARLHMLLRQWVRRGVVSTDEGGWPRFGDVYDRITNTTEESA